MPSRAPSRWLLLLTALGTLSGPAHALDASGRAEVVEALAGLLEARYVSPETGAAFALALRDHLSRGDYDDLESARALGERLTADLRAVRADDHLEVRPRGRTEPEAVDEPYRPGYEIREVAILADNVGVVDLRLFPSGPEFAERLRAAMTLLADVDALIVDLRRNTGGSPGGVATLWGHLVPGGTHLLSMIRRGDPAPTEARATRVEGPVLRDVPLAILTGPRTISAAEAFVFGLRGIGRGTVVGEPTDGGGHFGGPRDLPHGMEVWLPEGRAYDPATGQGWESTGIAPDLRCPDDDARDRAHAALAPAARARRAAIEAETARIRDEIRSAYAEFRSREEELDRGGLIALVETRWGPFLDSGHLDEGDLNRFGYHALGDHPAVAVALFTVNASRHPGSWNVHDSLGEGLTVLGETDAAIESYARSLELEPGNDHARGEIARLRAR